MFKFDFDTNKKTFTKEDFLAEARGLSKLFGTLTEEMVETIAKDWDQYDKQAGDLLRNVGKSYRDLAGHLRTRSEN